jgi:hypothetical protein
VTWRRSRIRAWPAGDGVPRHAGAGALAQSRDAQRLHPRRGASVQAGDGQRAELERAPDVAEGRVAETEDLRCARGDRELVQRVKEEVLREVALGDRAQRAAAQHRHAGRADLPAPRRDERVRQPAGVAPAVAGRELGEVAVVVAQLLPELLARDVQQRVQPPLVVGDPVVVDPGLGRQPVRWRIGRGQRVVGLRGGRPGNQREDGEGEQRDPAHARFYTASRRGVKVWGDLVEVSAARRVRRCAALTAASRGGVPAAPGRAVQALACWVVRPGATQASILRGSSPRARTTASGRAATGPLPLGEL